MAEPLKNQYGPDIPKRIAQMLQSAYPEFDEPGFVDQCLSGYEDLELMDRAKHICQAMRVHLPKDFATTSRIIIQSLQAPLPNTEEFGMAPFIYLPHVFYAAQFGLSDFEQAMALQYELTQRFTAEFSIRAYLEHHPEDTLSKLRSWASDPSPHVRRLVSEGTRPRLPWAPRLKGFQKDPSEVFALLTLLKDDPSLYVRRSVANNLNDIYKDHPNKVLDVCENWWPDADANRRWVITHALRSALKQGDVRALRLLGYNAPQNIQIEDASITPRQPTIGQTVTIDVELLNTSAETQNLMVDCVVHFVKANGQTSPKVFKLKTLSLEGGACSSFSKAIALKQLTTRKHYPGNHEVELVINGEVKPVGRFCLVTGP